MLRGFRVIKQIHMFTSSMFFGNIIETGFRVFLGRKWTVAVPIFTLFNFFPLQTYFYAISHLLSMLKPKSDR